jgi:hypothetical protein
MDLFADDIVVHAKTPGARGKSGSGRSTKLGARGGSKQNSKRDAKHNKQTSCYSSKHARMQAAKTEASKQKQASPPPDAGSEKHTKK